MPLKTRRNKVLRAHGDDLLAAGKGMQALANISKDAATKRAASADAKYFFSKHKAKTKKR
jgi:hypothetical protein